MRRARRTGIILFAGTKYHPGREAKRICTRKMRKKSVECGARLGLWLPLLDGSSPHLRLMLASCTVHGRWHCIQRRARRLVFASGLPEFSHFVGHVQRPMQTWPIIRLVRLSVAVECCFVPVRRLSRRAPPRPASSCGERERLGLLRALRLGRRSARSRCHRHKSWCPLRLRRRSRRRGCWWRGWLRGRVWCRMRRCGRFHMRRGSCVRRFGLMQRLWPRSGRCAWFRVSVG